MRRRTKAIAASAAVAIAVILAAIVLLATLQTALTTESARNALDPVYVQPQPNVQARLAQSATAGNLTFSVQNVMNGTNALQVWSSVNATNHYAPLNPIPGSTYAVINVTVASAIKGATPFSYSSLSAATEGRTTRTTPRATRVAAPRLPQLSSSPAARVTSTSRFLFLTTLHRRRLCTRHQTPR